MDSRQWESASNISINVIALY